LNERSADDPIRTALARDDPAAVELMWDRYAVDLLAFLTVTLRSRADAEDVLQNVFIKIVRNRRRLAGTGRLDGYVFRIARNEAVTFLRRRRRERTGASRWLAPANADGPDRDLAEQLEVALNPHRVLAGSRSPIDGQSVKEYVDTVRRMLEEAPRPESSDPHSSPNDRSQQSLGRS